MDMLKTDVLIVGAGPAGAATAAFLGRFGTRALMISRHRGTADTPRAHIVNQRTMEAMRDAGNTPPGAPSGPGMPNWA